jgi:DNA-binding transcriptional LysR family regulator
MKKLPDLEAWAIFAKVAETGSFARTAQELSLSQATVSKAISRLESRLKTMLLHRTSRRVALTDAGQAALERATRILQEGESVETEVMDHATSLRGQVRVAAPMTFGISRLAPLLPGFMLQHPDVDLQVQFSDAQVDLIAERFDLALRIANLEDSSLLARRLCRVRLLLVGAPAYFQRHGHPGIPATCGSTAPCITATRPMVRPWHFRHAQRANSPRSCMPSCTPTMPRR